jgi:hypothetical protein
VTGPGENYRTRLDAAQWSTLLAILTELKAIRGLLEEQAHSQSWPQPLAQVAPRAAERPAQRPRRFGDETDPSIGAQEYWPHGQLAQPPEVPPGGAHRG